MFVDSLENMNLCFVEDASENNHHILVSTNSDEPLALALFMSNPLNSGTLLPNFSKSSKNALFNYLTSGVQNSQSFQFQSKIKL